jgi:hypothetical protein
MAWVRSRFSVAPSTSLARPTAAAPRTVLSLSLPSALTKALMARESPSLASDSAADSRTL